MTVFLIVSHHNTGKDKTRSKYYCNCTLGFWDKKCNSTFSRERSQLNGKSVSKGGTVVTGCLPPMWPGFESWCQCHMRVEFVVGSLACSERVFSRYSNFPPLLKNQHFQIPIQSGMHGHVLTSSEELFSAPWVNKLQIIYKNYS